MSVNIPVMERPAPSSTSPASAPHADAERHAPLLRFLRAQIQPAFIAFELGLLILVIRTFSIESKALLWVMAIAFGGFIVNHLLPQRLRLPFFSLLSIGAIAFLLGPANAAWLIGIGLVLIACAHLPIPYAARVVLIISLAAILACLRKEVWTSPISAVVWPILGSMFMFRLMVYLYDLKHRTAPFGFWQALSYFFMLPNVCFPLFPVVDYRTFCRSHYSDDAVRIYQTGIHWVFRGVIQLLLYRLIYQSVLIDPTTIADPLGAWRFAVATYLLYLKVSGSFHLIIGLLHLFGFNLPETNHLYLLSSSFSDFWRRINIYWKDFILKLFFNPLYFQFKRRLSPANAIIAATLVAFTATWLLHSYQWFWIRGDFPLIWQDVVFWSILGIGVAITAVYESRVTRQKSLKSVGPSIAARIRRSLCAMAMFAFLCTLWTLWTAPSWGDWSVLMSHFGKLDAAGALAIAGTLLAIGVASFIVGHTARLAGEVRASSRGNSRRFWPQMIVLIVATLAIYGIGSHPLLLAFSPRAVEVLDDLKHPDRLNQRDTKMLERGYYEDLTNAARFNPQLAELYTNRPTDWNAGQAVRQTGGFPPYELIPSQAVHYKGVVQTTNQWGMRDREYAKTKPPGTIRIALLGSSHTKGSGVSDQETYENVVEERLNREGVLPDGRRVEILNFSVGGYGPLCRLAVLRQKVFDFDPDMVISEGIDDLTWIVTELANAVDRGYEIPFEHVRRVLESDGLAQGLPRLLAEKKLRGHAKEMLAWTYTQFAEDCRARGVAAYAMFLPRPEDLKEEPALIAEQTRLAEAAGLPVLDVSTAYAAVRDKESLWLAKWDRHPNARGHRLVAEAFYKEIYEIVLSRESR